MWWYTIFLIVLFGFFYPPEAKSHQWTPTYTTWRTSYVEDVLVTSMVLFNARDDVEYYEIQVLDGEFNPVPFATGERLYHLNHLRRKVIDVYISSKDEERAVYICSRSKSLQGSGNNTVLSSRICSKAI